MDYELLRQETILDSALRGCDRVSRYLGVHPEPKKNKEIRELLQHSNPLLEHSTLRYRR